MNIRVFIHILFVLSLFVLSQDRLIVSNDTTGNIEQKMDTNDVVLENPNIEIADSSGEYLDTLTHFTSLLIETVPESVAIFIDNKHRGFSPVLITNIKVGAHSIVLKKKGFFVKTTTVALTNVKENKISITLRAPASLSIVSEPPDAFISIDDKAVGKTPYRSERLKPDTYKIRVKKSGFYIVEKTAILTNGGSDSLYLVLEEKTSSIDTSSVADASENKAKGKSTNSDGNERSKISKVFDKVALGLFLGFSIILLVIELTQTK